jgi:apolipoprotein N-acyltransferase
MFRVLARRPVTAALASGALVLASLPPFDQAWLAWVAYVPLFAAVAATTPGPAFVLGVVAWLPCSACVGAGFLPLGLPLGLAYPTLIPLFVGAVCALHAALARRAPVLAAAALPGAWVLAEAGGTVAGIPWSIAVSQASTLAVVQIAALFGINAVAFLIVLVNAGLAHLVRAGGTPPARRLAGAIAAMLLAVLAFGSRRLAARDDAPPSVRVASVQPMLASELYTYQWLNPRYRDTVRSVVAELSEDAAARRPGLLLWPENGNGQVNLRVPALRDAVARLARRSGATLVLSSYDMDELGRRYNAVFSVAPSGEILGRYVKRWLAPGGEQGFTAGDRLVPLATPEGDVGVLVCLESTIGRHARALVRQGARLLIVPTSDVAFAGAPPARHHEGFAVYRAVENARWLVQASNGGPSFIVDPYGVVTASTPLGRTVLDGTVAFSDVATLYTRVGDVPLLVLATVLVATAIGTAIRRRADAASARPGWRSVPGGLAAATLGVAACAFTTGDRPVSSLRQAAVEVPADAGRAYRVERPADAWAASLAYALDILGFDATPAAVASGVADAAGDDLERVVAAARERGLRAWREHLGLDGLAALPLPVVAQMNDRVVVVLDVAAGHVDLFDPLAGFRRWSSAGVAASWRAEVAVVRFPPLDTAGRAGRSAGGRRGAT